MHLCVGRTYYQFGECEDVKYRVSARCKWGCVWSETLCGFAIPLRRVSERESLEQAVQQGWISFDSSSSGSSSSVSCTHNSILLLQRALSQIHFKLSLSHLSNRQSRLEIMRPIKIMLHYLHYTTRRLVHLLRERIIYWFIVGCIEKQRRFPLVLMLLTFSSLKCQPRRWLIDLALSLANN